MRLGFNRDFSTSRLSSCARSPILSATKTWQLLNPNRKDGMAKRSYPWRTPKCSLVWDPLLSSQLCPYQESWMHRIHCILIQMLNILWKGKRCFPLLRCLARSLLCCEIWVIEYKDFNLAFIALFSINKWTIKVCISPEDVEFATKAK